MTDARPAHHPQIDPLAASFPRERPVGPIDAGDRAASEAAVCFDTEAGHLAAVGHRLERLPFRGDGDRSGSLGESPVAGVRWRLTLAAPGESGGDVIELPGGHDVPRVLVVLLAAVTRGRPLVPAGDPITVDDTAAGERTSRPAPRARPAPGRSPATARLHARSRLADVVRVAGARARDGLLVVSPHLLLDAEPAHVDAALRALQRLRHELRGLRHVLRPGPTDRLRDELAWLGGLVAQVGAIDLALGRLDEMAVDAADAAVPALRRRARNERRVAALVLRNALASPRVARLVDSLDRIVDDPWLRKGLGATRDVPRAVLVGVDRADRRLLETMRTMEVPPTATSFVALHRRTRSLVALTTLLTPVAGTARLAQAAQGLEGVLDPVHDAEVLRAWIDRPRWPGLADAGGVASATVAAVLAVLVDGAARDVERARADWPAAWALTQPAAWRPWRD